MKHHDVTPTWACLEQVYLIERDAGLLCRILGLYAARGIDVLRADYTHAAQDVMTLKVSAAQGDPQTADTLRVLVAKAATFAGVMAAGEQHPTPRAALHRGARRIGIHGGDVARSRVADDD